MSKRRTEKDLLKELFVSTKDRIEYLHCQLNTPNIEAPLHDCVLQLKKKMDIIIFFLKLNRLTPYKTANLDGWEDQLKDLTTDLELQDIERITISDSGQKAEEK